MNILLLGYSSRNDVLYHPEFDLNFDSKSRYGKIYHVNPNYSYFIIVLDDII